jgi:membrane-bound serine protease (ClpP class)
LVDFVILIFAGVTHAGDVIVLTYAGPIGSVSAEYVSRSITEGEARGAAAVILQLDTPGGLDSSMRQIIQREMNARVPVVVYVAPRGARAASAGCLIVLGADVAAMAPGTNIGAAHPVDLSGGPVSEKILNDAVAYARSLAAMHGRNEAWAERAVRESASVPAPEAVRLHVVDLPANDLNDLIRQLNGRTVHAAARDVTLSLAGAPQVLLGMSWRERLFNTLANPNVAYLLFLLGVLALIAEIFAPHGMVTGTLGVLAMILAVIGLANLPIQLSGALLLILGMVLLVLELKITSHGVLTVVGLIAFIFGSVLLFPDIPGYHLSPWAIGSVAVLWAVLLSAVVRLVLKARHGPKLVGVERLVGTIGVAKTELAPRGVVLLSGEDWDAQADPSPVGRGERVQVLEVQGLTLRVRKLS